MREIDDACPELVVVARTRAEAAENVGPFSDTHVIRAQNSASSRVYSFDAQHTAIACEPEFSGIYSPAIPRSEGALGPQEIW